MFSAIVLAGGAGFRARRALPKQFTDIAGKPMIMHSLERLDELDAVEEIVIPCHPESRERLERDIRAYGLGTPCRVIDGGETRQQSTRFGLLAATGDNVVIHEAARPFVKKEEFVRLIEAPGESVIYAVNVPFTVSLARDGKLAGLLERRELINVQLPQKFPRLPLLRAHDKAAEEGRQFTEDAGVLYYYGGDGGDGGENGGVDIHIIQGTHWNVKITEPVDFAVAEEIYREYILK